MSNSDAADQTRRPAAAEIEVSASPEEVWQAVASGDGLAAWLFAAEVEPRVGGDVTIHRAPFGPDATATVTRWEPPHVLAYEEQLPAREPSATESLATEFLVEACRGGTCVVRVVTSITGDSEGWEDLLEGATAGWQMSLRMLASYLAHFAGQSATNLDLILDARRPAADRDAVLGVVVERLGLLGQGAGDSFRTPPGAPRLAGKIEYADRAFVLLRASDPAPGLVALSTLPMDGATLTVNVLGRLYGPDGPRVAEREVTRWGTWLAEVAG